MVEVVRGRELAQDLDQEALPERTWGQRSAWVCGMGCQGKERNLLSRSVGGSFEQTSSLLFDLPKRKSPWFL